MLSGARVCSAALVVGLLVAGSVFAPSQSLAAEPTAALDVVLTLPGDQATFERASKELLAALKEAEGLSLLAVHNMHGMGVADRTVVAEVCNEEVKKAVLDVGGGALLTAPWELAISPHGDRLVVTILNPEVVVWAFYNEAPADKRARALAAFKGLVAKVKEVVRARITGGTPVDEGLGPRYQAADLAHLRAADFMEVVYEAKAVAHDPRHDVDRVLEAVTEGMWLTPKWKVTEVFRPSPTVAMFGVCHKGYATKALSMGAYHAPALPCAAAVWLQGKKVKVGMLKPDRIFRLYFADAPKLAFIENMMLPGDVEDEIRRGLTRGLGHKPGQTVGKPKWFAWGQMGFFDRLGSLDDDDGDSTFGIKRARLGVTGLAKPYWQYHAMLELSGGAPKLMQAWVNWRMHDALQLRLGQFKHGFGREALPSATRWKFQDPSLVVQRMGAKLGRQGGAYRDAGVMAHGAQGLGPVGLNYSVFLMQGNGINAVDDNGSKDVVGHLGLNLMRYLHVGGTYYQGTATLTTDDGASHDLAESAFGVDVAVLHPRFTLQGEYLQGSLERASGDALKPGGYYASGSVLLMPWLEVVGRWSSYDANLDDDDDDAGEQKLTAGMAVYFNKVNRLGVEYSMHWRDSAGDPADFIGVMAQGVL